MFISLWSILLNMRQPCFGFLDWSGLCQSVFMEGDQLFRIYCKIENVRMVSNMAGMSEVPSEATGGLPG